MSHKGESHEKSSSKKCSSSSSSSSCCDSVSHGCDPCPDFCPEEIFDLLHNGVVNIHSVVQLTTQSTVPSPSEDNNNEPEEVKLGQIQPGVNTETFLMHGNGFFIKDHLIVCPASLVLVPPTLLGNLNRYPYVSATPVAPTGVLPNYMTKMDRFFVDVFNVNGEKKSYTYEAKLCLVDGAGDIAVLKIKSCSSVFNKGNPEIKDCHPYLKWGRSRRTKVGTKIYTLGDAYTSWRPDQLRAVSGTDTIPMGTPELGEGRLLNNRYLDFGGFAQQELVKVSVQVQNNKVGMPIITGQGYVIGMQTTNLDGAKGYPLYTTSYTDGYVSGPSEFFMRQVIRTALSSSKSRLCRDHREEVVDALGNYHRYTKGYLGIAWDVVTGADFAVTVSNGSTGATGSYNMIPTSSDVKACHQLRGLRVATVAGSTSYTSSAFVPGGSTAVSVGAFIYPPGDGQTPGATGAYGTLSTIAASPLLGILSQGDIVTEIGECSLGAYGEKECEHQIVGSLITWKKKAGDSVCVKYRKMSEGYTQSYSTKVTLANYPMFMDYPWYKVNKFPKSQLFNALNYPYFPGTDFRPAF